jgi:hypothetical protein
MRMRFIVERPVLSIRMICAVGLTLVQVYSGGQYNLLPDFLLLLITYQLLIAEEIKRGLS